MQPSWAKTFFFPFFFRNKWALFKTLVLVVLFLSLIPQSSFPKVGFTRIDLVVHLIMYSALAYSLSLAMYDIILSKSKSVWFFPLLLGGLGLGIEILQKILPLNRFFSWEDAISNFLGACSFFLWMHWIRQ